MKRLLLLALLATPHFAVAQAEAPPKSALAKDTPSKDTPAKETIPKDATPQELEQGKKAAEELEKSKTIKLLDPDSSPEAKLLVDKLNGMAKRLGAVSTRPGIPYVVKVIEDKDVNAFTLPGGRIYFYRGLIDYASSDDEIAGVLAHEIGHNTRMHALRGEKQAKKLSLANLAALAAILAGGQSGANVGQFTQYLLMGVMNGYGIGYEKEADSSGVEMMIGAGYNPSAMVTFMQRLSLLEKRSPEFKLGIFQTHPPSDERADAILNQLKEEKIAFEPRAVTGGKTAVVNETDDRITLKVSDVIVLELAKSGANAPARAQSAATKINEFLRSNGQIHEITTTADGKLLGRGQLLVVANAADAKLQNLALSALAPQWKANMQRLFWRERINGRF
jgi:predicted Zn-dependent protease